MNQNKRNICWKEDHKTLFWEQKLHFKVGLTPSKKVDFICFYNRSVNRIERKKIPKCDVKASPRCFDKKSKLSNNQQPEML